MNKHLNLSNNNKGVVLVVALLIMSTIMILGVSLFVNSSFRQTVSENNKKRIQSFYAADAIITILAQETYDGNHLKYISDYGSDSSNIKVSQAENATYSGGIFKNDNTGYKGTGYIDFINNTNDYIEWDVNITISGFYNIGFRYAMGTFTNRPLECKINGSIANASLAFQTTGSWIKWDTVFVFSNLNYGPNKIRLTAIGLSGGNIDELIVSQGGKGSGAENFDGFTVTWNIQELKPNCFNIGTDAFLDYSGKQKYKVPLEQYLELEGKAITNLYESEVMVPVTFYDFHSDRTNPEFEQPHRGGVRKNMVGLHLDSERKPVVGSNPYLNYYIKYWFRPWQDLAKFDGDIPIYQTTPPYKGCVAQEYLPAAIIIGAPNAAYGTCKADSAFRNVVLDTFLTFTHLGSGVYHFKQDSNFFPLDGKGFHDNWNQDKECNSGTNTNNFSFTMEMHRTFIKQPGQMFRFKGDDDVWLFINNNLVMDLGGIHIPAEDSVFMDSLSGLADNEEYNIDFFFCERHSDGSSIWITTNMLSYVNISENRRNWGRSYNFSY